MDLPSSPTLAAGRIANLSSSGAGASIKAFVEPVFQDVLQELNQNVPYELMRTLPEVDVF